MKPTQAHKNYPLSFTLFPGGVSRLSPRGAQRHPDCAACAAKVISLKPQCKCASGLQQHDRYYGSYRVQPWHRRRVVAVHPTATAAAQPNCSHFYPITNAQYVHRAYEAITNTAAVRQLYSVDNDRHVGKIFFSFRFPFLPHSSTICGCSHLVGGPTGVRVCLAVSVCVSHFLRSRGILLYCQTSMRITQRKICRKIFFCKGATL